MSSVGAAGRFDVHQHVGIIPELELESNETGTLQVDIRMRLAFMDAFGISQAALMPAHSYSAPNGLADVRSINQALLAYRQAHPQRFPVTVGTLDARHGTKSIDEVEVLRKQGFQAISWHPRMQGLPMDHPVMFSIIDRMDSCGLVAMIHCFAGADFEEVWRFRRLAERFPDTTFIALDSMSSAETLHSVLDAARILGNIHVDLTISSLGPAGVAACIDQIGCHRLVFGTNYYSLTKRSRLTELSDLERSGLTDAETALITGGNARRIFGMS